MIRSDGEAQDANLFLQRVLKEAASNAGRREVPTAPVRNYENAFELLECAARALEFLQIRREQLETAFEALKARSDAALAAAEDRGEEWQRLAMAMKAEAQDCERRLAATERRAEAAEAQAEFERQRAIAAEQRASTASTVSTNFHDKIVAVFGKGSRIEKTLAAIAQGSDFDPSLD